VLQREDICTVGGAALGLAQGARSKERATERFDVLQLLAVNYSMSRGGLGGLVASGRVLRPQRRPRCDGSHGMGWDGNVVQGLVDGGRSPASGSSRLQDSIMSLNHRVASDRIVRQRYVQ
jgi:hypothetical protein